MSGFLEVLKQILSTPAIFVGIISLVGLIAQHKNFQQCFSGTVKTILGFLVLGAGAGLICSSVIPFGDLFKYAFGLEGVVANNEAIVSLGLKDFAVQTASIFAIGMCFNIILARFSKLKYIFLTGHHTLYMACLIAVILVIVGFSGFKLIITGSLLLGLVMTIFPALMQPVMRKVTGDDSLALGHFGSGCYWLSAQIGKIFGRKPGFKTTEDIEFPKGLQFLRETTISISLTMFICYMIVSIASVVQSVPECAEIFGETNWVLFSILNSIQFAAGVYIVLSGVRMLINEIVPAFKGISEKIVPNAKPALDCPIVFTYAPNAVIIGFLCSFIGGIVGLFILAAFGNIGLSTAIILPGAVLHFFCGATAGVCGNSTGGLKGCILGAFVHGLIATFLIAGLYPIMSALGFQGTTFSDTDFTIVGISLGLLVKIISPDAIMGIVIGLYLLPIILALFKKTKKNA